MKGLTFFSQPASLPPSPGNGPPNGHHPWTASSIAAHPPSSFVAAVSRGDPKRHHPYGPYGATVPNLFSGILVACPCVCVCMYVACACMYSVCVRVLAPDGFFLFFCDSMGFFFIFILVCQSYAARQGPSQITQVSFFFLTTQKKNPRKSGWSLSAAAINWLVITTPETKQKNEKKSRAIQDQGKRRIKLPEDCGASRGPWGARSQLRISNTQQQQHFIPHSSLFPHLHPTRQSRPRHLASPLTHIPSPSHPKSHPPAHTTHCEASVQGTALQQLTCQRLLARASFRLNVAGSSALFFSFLFHLFGC